MSELDKIRNASHHMDEFWRKLGSDPKAASAALENAASLATTQPLLRAMKPDPRDPDHSRAGIFVYHNCWKCQSGARPCAVGNPNQCGSPVARND